MSLADPQYAYDDGAPVLAGEVISPSDRYGDVWEQIDLDLAAGSVVWVVDPVFCTAGVDRPGRVVECLNVDHELPGEPGFPGLRVNVSEFFD